MIEDLETLLQPINQAAPTGEDLSYDPLLDQIREARRADDDSLPMGVWERELKKADWKETNRLCQDVLRNQSKDLQVALWLLEAQIQLNGFAGLHQGVYLITELCRRYWDSFHPQPENGDVTRRLSMFHKMGRQLVASIKQTPITRPVDHDVPTYHFLHWESAVHHITTPKAKEEAAVSIAKFNKSMELTPSSHLQSLVSALTDAVPLLGEIQQRLDDTKAEDIPSLMGAIEALDLIRGKIMKVLRERGSEADLPAESAEKVSAPAAFAESKSDPAPLPKQFIGGRDHAYRLLDEIADFLMKTEPHSPTPYLLKRIASWGDMTLFDLLQEVAPGKDEQSRIKELFFLLKDDQPSR